MIMYTPKDLSEKQAKTYSEVIGKAVNLPWHIFVLIGSTIRSRSGPKSENVRGSGHGRGFAIGHQWTNILLISDGIMIPLPPIPFHTKKYCRENGLAYMTEHERIIGYIDRSDSYEYIGFHNDKNVVVPTDSGYDNKKIRNAVPGKGRHFITAPGSSRGVKSEARHAKTPKSSDWDGIAVFFKKYRKLAWKTVRIFTDGPKRRRKEFRMRHAEVFPEGVGKIRAVCSESGKKRDGRRKHIACSDPEATPRQILIAYGLRRKIEIFHKHMKMCLGFGDIAAKHFSSVESHVCLAYCAYLLPDAGLPGIGTNCAIPEKQRKVAEILENKKTAFVIHELTEIGGVGKYKNRLKSALAA